MEALILVLFLLIMILLGLEAYQVKRDRALLQHVVYVNGIRGKSTVTRMIAAGLKSGGWSVFCKTTGTVPRLIGTDGVERPLRRRGKANIREQARVMRMAVREHGMLPEQKMEILERLEQAGLVIFQEPKFLNNLEQRQEIYERQGPIQCFVSVGGNVTSMGVGERGIALGQGVLDPRSAMPVTDQSGLVERYLGRGIPVVHLLNIKQLTAEYGLPYDPVQWPDPGSSAVYYRIQYPLLPIVLGLLAAAGILCLCRHVRIQRSNMWHRELPPTS